MWCGRRMKSAAALATVLACASVALARSSCEQLASLHRGGEAEAVTVRGEELGVVVYGSAGPALAAAALLRAVLRHALHYTRVELREGPRDLCRLTGQIRRYRNEAAVVPAAAWSWRDRCDKQWGGCHPLADGSCALGGPALVTLGAAAAPVTARAYVRLSPSARRSAACAHASLWPFYGNVSALRQCSFLNADNSSRAIMYVAIPTLQDVSEARTLIERIIAKSWAIRFEAVSRAALLGMLRDGNGSFLFLDWEVWVQFPGVEPMGAAPCACRRLPCELEHDIVGVFAVSELLLKYAPRIYGIIRKCSVRPEDLRDVLDREINGNMTEAACDWALEHHTKFSECVNQTLADDYLVVVLICKEHEEYDMYKTIGIRFYRELKELNLDIDVRLVNVTCSNPDTIHSAYSNVAGSTRRYGLLGVVAGAEGADALADRAAPAHFALVSTDPNGNITHAPFESVDDMATALRNFIKECEWIRVAVISESTPYAKALVKALGSDRELVLGEIVLMNANDLHIRQMLRELQDKEARVILVNTGAQTAAAVVREATGLGMTPGAGYAWVTREWGGASLAPSMRVFSVSSRCRGGGEAGAAGARGPAAALRRHLDSTWRGRWPLRAAAFADVLLTLGLGYVNLFKRYPEARNDLHTENASRLFWKGLETANVSGVCQELHYEGRALVEPRVFIHEWYNDTAELVAAWRVRRGRVTQRRALRPAYLRAAPPLDRRSRCAVRSGDAFAPRCHDVTLAGALLLALAAGSGSLVLARRVLQRRLSKYEREIRLSVLSRRQRSVQALASCLVPREQLELRGELGAGRSGRVHLALLRVPGRAPRAVAAKSLREDAAPSAESEFLREACTLAALDHEHVVRLVGVCTDDALLVLMEHAFFGDLLGYLRARRHLAEGADCAAADSRAPDGEEATHVSAAALTRLVREAASALAYLAQRGIVHRDVRAANCLVDARRSLKLGDFGMARETGAAGADGEAEYACRRRGMFPVLWMAPESLKRGAFSAASDVWALGVLVLEVVTLGARPYGAWSPLRVLEWVVGGGRPRLPLDATMQTRGVALACWRREAAERPRACELVAYLAEHPRALRPALVLECAAPEDAVDSGYGGYGAEDASDSSARPSPDSATPFFPQ